MAKTDPHEDNHNIRLAQLPQEKGLAASLPYKSTKGKVGTVYAGLDHRRISLEAKVGNPDILLRTIGHKSGIVPAFKGHCPERRRRNQHYPLAKGNRRLSLARGIPRPTTTDSNAAPCLRQAVLGVIGVGDSKFMTLTLALDRQANLRESTRLQVLMLARLCYRQMAKF